MTTITEPRGELFFKCISLKLAWLEYFQNEPVENIFRIRNPGYSSTKFFFVQSEPDNFLAMIVIIKSSCLHVVQFCKANKTFSLYFSGHVYSRRLQIIINRSDKTSLFSKIVILYNQDCRISYQCYQSRISISKLKHSVDVAFVAMVIDYLKNFSSIFPQATGVIQ